MSCIRTTELIIQNTEYILILWTKEPGTLVLPPATQQILSKQH